MTQEGAMTPQERAQQFFDELPEFDGTLEEAFAAGRADEIASTRESWGHSRTCPIERGRHACTCGREGAENSGLVEAIEDAFDWLPANSGVGMDWLLTTQAAALAVLESDWLAGVVREAKAEGWDERERGVLRSEGIEPRPAYFSRNPFRQ